MMHDTAIREMTFDWASLFIVITYTLSTYSVILLFYLSWLLWGIRKKQRKCLSSFKSLRFSFFLRVLVFCNVIIGIFALPNYLVKKGWIAIQVINDSNFGQVQSLCLLTCILTFLVSSIAWLFPHANMYVGKLTKVILSGFFAAVLHVVIISKFSSSLEADNHFVTAMSLFSSLLFLYVLTRRLFEFQLIQISKNLAFDLRCKIAKKIFSTPFENFEKLDKGKVYSVLSSDTTTISAGAGTMATLVVSILTILGAFAYLTTINLNLTVILLSVIILLAIIYYIVSVRTEIYFEKARDQRTVFMGLIDGLVNGGKEINLRSTGRKQYEEDLVNSAESYRDLTITSSVKFLNVEMVGEVMMLMLIGVFAFGLPVFIDQLDIYVQASFLIVILYILGPVQFILAAVPKFMEVKVAWRRIKSFLQEIPTSKTDLEENDNSLKSVARLELVDVFYTYKNRMPGEQAFQVGPINLNVQKAEITFIIGANGSGKSTLAKLLVGLYKVDQGRILVDGKTLSNLGNLYSAVFNPPYLFKRLYNLTKFDEEKTRVLLSIFSLEEKVSIKDGEYTSLDLSSGQRKRLALVQCFLEDSPIFLFDEWAADQDPTYKRFFYTELLPEMKKLGKIVIAITHDDNYFHVADRVLEMKDGILVESEKAVPEMEPR